MKSRGEARFIRLSALGAGNYKKLMEGPAAGKHYPEFARDLAAKLHGGKLLDAGTGPGRMLLELHKLDPNLGLFGLDVSRTMIDLARRELAGVPADLRVGTIAHTDYADGSFDAVTCTKRRGIMSLRSWRIS